MKRAFLINAISLLLHGCCFFFNSSLVHTLDVHCRHSLTHIHHTHLLSYFFPLYVDFRMRVHCSLMHCNSMILAFFLHKFIICLNLSSANGNHILAPYVILLVCCLIFCLSFDGCIYSVRCFFLLFFLSYFQDEIMLLFLTLFPFRVCRENPNTAIFFIISGPRRL